MLTRWTISNFKSIHEPVTVELAPLTIFSGINSAGKSTLIQSILMVAQSFMAGAPESIILNGNFLQLGNLKGILHAGKEEPLEIGIEYLPGERGTLAFSIQTRLIPRLPRHSVAKRREQLHLHVDYTQLRFVRKEKGSTPRTLTVQSVPDADLKVPLHHLRPDLKNQIKIGIYDFALQGVDFEEFVREPALERVERVGMTTIIPWRLLVGLNRDLVELVKDVQWLISIMAEIEANEKIPVTGTNLPLLSPRLAEVVRRMKFDKRITPENRRRGSFEQNNLTPLFNRLTNRRQSLRNPFEILKFLREGGYTPEVVGTFSRLLTAALSEFLREQPNFTQTDKNDIDFEARLFPPEYAEALDQINIVLGQKVYYLGPLRDDPRAIYAIPPLSDKLSVGLKGEYTAAMLNQYCNEVIKYPLPPDQDFTGEYTYKEGSLTQAVVTWLQRMGLVDGIDTEETAKVGYQLTVSDKYLPHKLDLTSVGVGVSQILPTLVLALLVPNDTTLIFEQPELHLHPKVQSVMADFFMGIALMGKQCLVETHSEHFIHRLRRRIVESEQGTVLPNLRIYFVEKENSVSHFREVQPNEFGAILQWPKGFFDEAENESSLILKKQMGKRRHLHAQRKQKEEAS